MRAAREKALEILQKNGIKRAAFFGSIVRGEMTDESDIDILVEFEGRKSLLDLAGLKLDLEDALERRVDLLTYRSLPSQAQRQDSRGTGPYIMKNLPVLSPPAQKPQDILPHLQKLGAHPVSWPLQLHIQ